MPRIIPKLGFGATISIPARFLHPHAIVYERYEKEHDMNTYCVENMLVLGSAFKKSRVKKLSVASSDTKILKTEKSMQVLPW